MKKVTAFIGTKCRKATFRAVQEFEKNLKLHADINFEYVFLSDYHLEFCQGCKACLLKREEFCPFKDDRNKILDMIEQSDGIVWATPTYAFQVSARMKNLFDRLAFIDHRPRFFGKTCTSIVTQGFYGGGNVLKYLNFASEAMGFKVAKGCCLSTLDPLTKPQFARLIRETKAAADRFYEALMQPEKSPSLLHLFVFRYGRTNIKLSLTEKDKDYQYYKEKGWFKSDYFYPTSLGLLKSLAGKMFDFIGLQLVKHQ